MSFPKDAIKADELVYGSLKESEADEVVEFMAQHFYPREPLSTGLHMTYEDNKEWIHGQVRDWVRGGASVVARDPRTNKIVGTLLATILTRAQNTSFDEALNSPKIKVKTLHKVLSVLEASVNFFAKYSVDKILELAMITVSEENGGKGIGRRLVQESEKRGKQLGCQLATAQATAVPSQKLLERLGYSSLYEMDYASFSINGELVFDMDRMLGTPSAKVMAKPLASFPSCAMRRLHGWKGQRMLKGNDRICFQEIEAGPELPTSSADIV